MKAAALLVAAFALSTLTPSGMSGVAQAKDDDDDGKACSDSTLRGLYAFTASGFNIVASVPQPKAIVELIRFNGDKTLTAPTATVSINSVIQPNTPNGPGSYMVRADCTGSLQFGPPGPTYDLFVEFKGSEIQMIQTGPGSPVFQGTAERLSR